jgi:hypothetical protein
MKRIEKRRAARAVRESRKPAPPVGAPPVEAVMAAREETPRPGVPDQEESE